MQLSNSSVREQVLGRSSFLGVLALAALSSSLLNATSAMAAPAPSDTFWRTVQAFPSDVESHPFVKPSSAQKLELDESRLHALLATAPLEGRLPVRQSPTVIVLPRPDGGFERFAFVESPVMQPELQAKSPGLRSYLGQGLDHRATTVRFDISPLGFRAQVLDTGGSRSGAPSVWYIEPASGGDTRHYLSFFRSDLGRPPEFKCSTPNTESAHMQPPGPASSPAQPDTTDSNPLEVVRNEFGIAVATTGEFSEGVGARMKPPQAPTLALIKGVVQTIIGRVNQILERDGPVRLLIVNNNDNLLYLNSATDPYTLPAASLVLMQKQFQDNINSVLGTTNYSFGHTLHWDATGPQGNAGAIGSVCNDSTKALAFSATDNEYGDYFAIDIVAHEIGHQLGATHTFNGMSGACNLNRTASSAYEPGSGSSIMAYGHNCGPDSIVSYPSLPPDPPPPDYDPTRNGENVPMYNLSSMIQIANFVTGVSCVAKIPTGNYHPGATPASQGPYYIPTDTPFRLNSPSAEFGGPNDSLTYSIEQYDLGPQWPLGQDSGQHEPLFRVLAPSTLSERKFPRFEYVLSGNPSLGENLPRFSRTSGFRGVLRDNVAGAGGWGWGDINVQFVLVPGDGFKVTAPSGGGAYCGGQVIGVTWNVASTNEAPINASTVDILMSTDGGQNFPWTLAADFPNSGAALVPLPSVPTTDARIQVQSAGGVFFNVNAGPFEVASGPPTIQSQPTPIAICRFQDFTLSYTPGPGSPRHNQWYKDGVAIPGATGQSYTRELADRADSGDYKVVVTNGCGTVTSNTVRVQVGVTFDQTPPAPNPQACQNVVLPSYARGVGMMTYQWFRDGQPIASDPRLTGVTGATLTIGASRYEDEGRYWCRVTDQCETRESEPVTVALPTPTWTQRSTTGPIKRGAVASALVYDANRQVSVLYGGTHPDGQLLGDTWEWDGLGWLQRSPPHSPGPTTQHEMVYDTVRKSVLLFGGYGTSPRPFNNSDVWSYGGNDWTLVTTSPSGPPPSVSLHGATAYDSARGKMLLLYQGANGTNTNPTNETWEFDSATAAWSLVSSGPGPENFLSPLAFDASRGFTVGQYHWWANAWSDAKTWTSTGQGWSLAGGSSTPPRYYPAMAYDDVRRRATFYSCCRGQGPGDYHTDTYAFDGSQWSMVLPDITTSQQDSVIPGGMTFDSRRRAMVMVGSAYNDAYYAGLQTWEYRYRDRVMFDRQPAGVGANTGSTVQFNAVADGAPSLTYRWRRGNTDLVDGPGPGDSTISGATTPTLTISSVSTADEGSYQLAATNLCGQQLSTPAPLAIAGGGSGRVPGDAGSTGAPLRVSRSGANVTLNWSPSCRPTDNDYEVYEGTIGSYYNHTPRLCSTSGATSATFTPAAGSRYFLVVPRDAAQEGSYGLDSKGLERPLGGSACLPRSISACP